MIIGQTPHSYEEVRDAIESLLMDDAWSMRRPSQFNDLIRGTAEYFLGGGNPAPSAYNLALHSQDEELVRDVFWDLFRLGYITLGLNNSNPNFPWFRISHRGSCILSSREPWKFHDTSSYFRLLSNNDIIISDLSKKYLEEALQSFYSDCNLSACVMLGVAAEAEFDDFLLSYPESGPLNGKFLKCRSQKFIAGRINEFRKIVPEFKALGLHEAADDLETNLNAVQSVLRTARNEAGHPTGLIPTREQVYIYLQLFIPFAKKLRQVRVAIAGTPSSATDGVAQ